MSRKSCVFAPFFALAVACAGAPPPGGADPDGDGFASTVQPVLNASCTNCHGTSAGLSLESYDSIMAGASGEAVVIPEKPEESELYLRLTGKKGPRMPPGGARLASDQIADIKRWIDNGAKND